MARKKKRKTAPSRDRRPRSLKVTLAVAVAAIGLIYFLAPRDNDKAAPTNAGPAAVEPSQPETLDPVVHQLIQQKIKRVRAAPKSADAHGTLGLTYAANDLWPEARDALAQAVQLSNTATSDGLIWRFHHALAVHRAGYVARSRELLTELANDAPDFAPAHQRLGEALLQAGDLEKARTAYERVAALSPETNDGNLGLAEIAIHERRFDDAVNLLEAAIGRDARDLSAHYLLGLAYRGQGDRAKAAEHMARGQNAPKRYLSDQGTERMQQFAVTLTAQINRAGVMLRSGNAQGALTLLEEAFETRGEDVRLMNSLAMAYMQTGKLQQAHKTLQRAQEIGAGELSTEMNLASVLLRMRRPQDALPWAESAAARAPDVAQTHFIHALILEQLGRRDEARTAAEKAQELEPTPQVAALLEKLS